MMEKKQHWYRKRESKIPNTLSFCITCFDAAVLIKPNDAYFCVCICISKSSFHRTHNIIEMEHTSIQHSIRKQIWENWKQFWFHYKCVVDFFSILLRDFFIFLPLRGFDIKSNDNFQELGNPINISFELIVFIYSLIFILYVNIYSSFMVNLK